MPNPSVIKAEKGTVVEVVLERPENRPPDRDDRIFLAKMFASDVPYVRTVFDIVFDHIEAQNNPRIRYVFVSIEEAEKIDQLMAGLFNNENVNYVFKKDGNGRGMKTAARRRGGNFN